MQRDLVGSVTTDNIGITYYTTADSSTHATLSILTAQLKRTAPQFRGNLEQKVAFTP